MRVLIYDELLAYEHNIYTNITENEIAIESVWKLPLKQTSMHSPHHIKLKNVFFIRCYRCKIICVYGDNVVISHHSPLVTFRPDWILSGYELCRGKVDRCSACLHLKRVIYKEHVWFKRCCQFCQELGGLGIYINVSNIQ